MEVSGRFGTNFFGHRGSGLPKPKRRSVFAAGPSICALSAGGTVSGLFLSGNGPGGICVQGVERNSVLGRRRRDWSGTPPGRSEIREKGGGPFHMARGLPFTGSPAAESAAWSRNTRYCPGKALTETDRKGAPLGDISPGGPTVPCRTGGPPPESGPPAP